LAAVTNRRYNGSMLELEAALEKILAELPPPVAEHVPLADAGRRFLAETISAPVPLPLFDNSGMDGYALRAEDAAAASAARPVALRLTGRIAAGQTFAGKLAPGQAIRIFTGSPLPAGADAVVMQEDTRTERPDEILVLDAVKPWENVRFRGEDLKSGAVAVEAGERLAAGRLALLAALGITGIAAGRRPSVAVLATGSELRSPGEPLAPGQIYESNRAGLAPLIQNAGGIVKSFPLVPDELNATRAALETAFTECDVVITCGGVSVGEMDFVKAAFEAIGGRLDFWKVAIKPGRPFVFGRRQNRFLFGLPGNPVSALVTFLLLVRPALLRWQGARQVGLPARPGILAEPLTNPGARRHFVRVILEPDGTIHSAGRQASHALSSAAAANGLVDLPPHANSLKGHPARVLQWE
jgi:molybdopterin molybdotransferase